MGSRSHWFGIALVFAIAAPIAAAPAGTILQAPRPAIMTATAATASSRLPLAFEINRGQTDARARFTARGSGMNVYLTDEGALLALRQAAPAALLAPAEQSPWAPSWLSVAAAAAGDAPAGLMNQALALRFRLANADPHPRMEGVDPLPGRSNHLIGSDPRQWYTDIPLYRGVRYRGVLPGVNVVYYGKDGELEFDVEVEPGVDLSRVRLRIDGADALAIDADGDLLVHTVLGDLTQRRPVVYQTIDGERSELRGVYELQASGDEVALAVPDYDRRYALVVDPTLVWTSQIGGSVGDASYGVAADSGGNWYFAGFSDHSATVNFPTTVGAYQTANNGGSDAFVRKVSNDGATLIYATLLGGSGNDTAYGIGVDDAGNAYVAGTTYSANFPTTPGAFQTSNPSGANAAGFIASVNAAGNGLNYSTYLGGTTGFIVGTSAKDIAVDAAGNAFVTGETTTDNLPTSADSFQPQPATSGNTSAFVFAFDASGTRVFGTYLVDDYLGFGSDHGAKIAIDDEGNAYVVGYTASHFGGTYNGVARTLLGPGGGTYDMLVARLNRTGKWLDWVTHIGGSGLDKGAAIAVDGGHQVMVAGWSASSDLPPSFTNNDDWAWIGQLDDTGTQVLDAAWIGAAGAATFPEAIFWDELIVAGSVQKPSALPAMDPIAGLDCAAQCGGNSSYGGFLALLTTGPLTLQSLTRVLGASGTDTRFHGVSQDATSPTGRTAAAGGSNGTFPGTPSGDTSQAAVAAVVDTRAAVATPPRVKKYFDPPTVAPNQETTLIITVYNAKSSPATISDFDLEDNLPGCVQFVAVVGGSLLANRDSAGRIFLTLRPAGEILPGAYKFAQIRVKAGPLTGPCTNTTGAATTNVGPAEPASATLNIEAKPCNASSTGTCTSMNMSDSACWSGNTPPANTCNAEIVPCTTQCNVNNDQPVDQKIDRLTIDAATSVSGGTLYLGGGLALPNPVNVAIAAPISAAAGALDIDVASPGAHLTTSDIRIFQNYAFFQGQGTTIVNGNITGHGQVSILGGSVTLAAIPTFTGQLSVTGGTLTANVAVQEKTFLDGGLLRGIGPFAAIEQVGGSFRPGTGTTPADVDVGDLTLLSKLILDYGPGNATHSSVNGTGSVLLSGMTVQLNFATAPAVDATFPNLITSPGGSISGCPSLVVAAQPNLVLTPLCTPTAVGAKVYSNERVFLGNFQF